MATPAAQNNAIIFAAVLGLGVYAVYAVGDLQSVIYAVCGAYAIRLLLRNPDILKQLQSQIRNIGLQAQTQLRAQPQLRPQPVYTYDGQPIAAVQQDPAYPSYPQQQLPQGYPRLDMNYMEPPQPPAHYASPPANLETSFLDELMRSPQMSFPQYEQPPSRSQPSRATTAAMDDFPVPARNPYGSYSHYDAGTINGERMAAAAAHMPSTASTTSSGRSSTVAVSAAEGFPIPTRNPYGSYSHYDAGTIGGERIAPHAQVPVDVASDEKAPTRPDSVMSNPADSFPTPVKNPYGSYSHYDAGTIGGQKIGGQQQPVMLAPAPTSRAPSANSQKPTTTFAPSPLRSETSPKEEYTFKRKHRMPTISARVPGMSPLPGAGMITSPTHLKALGTSYSVSSDKQVLSPVPVPAPVLEPLAKLLDSPLLQSPCGYDSDSSHASSSSGSGSAPGNAGEHGRPGEGHNRSESSASSLGVPTYEKHVSRCP